MEYSLGMNALFWLFAPPIILFILTLYFYVKEGKEQNE